MTTSLVIDVPATPPVLRESARRGLDRFRDDPRRAVEEDAITCLLCGRRFRQLTNTHLRAHGTTALGYKDRFGYNRRRPLMAASLRRLYAARAVRVGLADHIGHRPIVLEPELRRRGGRRRMTREELLNRLEGQRRSRPLSLAPARA